jgi:DUF1365 family protein
MPFDQIHSETDSADQELYERSELSSAIYSGVVRHRRYGEKTNNFSYKVFMVYLDLQELDQVFSLSPWWSNKKFNFAWYKRSDYGVFCDGLDHNKETVNQADKMRSTSVSANTNTNVDSSINVNTSIKGSKLEKNSLYNNIAGLVEKESGVRPSGPIRMLTNLRYFGYIINPITCYYCFDESGKQLQTIVAEVTNTPWKERCHYVLPVNNDMQSKQEIYFSKTMHVSPFQPMNLEYCWRGKTPEKNLLVHIDVFKEQQRIFDATMTLTRSAMTKKNMHSFLFRYPLMTMKVFLGIHWQAIILFFKKITYHPNPKGKGDSNIQLLTKNKI